MECVPSLRLIAGPPALAQIDRYIDELWAAHPHVPPRIRVRMGIAINEIAANIVKHAVKGVDGTVRLQIVAIVRDNDVLVTFTDDGIAATDGLANRAMPHELDECGRGIPLARATLSLLEYRRTDERNLWTLVSEHF